MIQTQLRNGIALLFWVGVLLAVFLYSLSTSVLAHAEYDDTVPAAGEVVSQAPFDILYALAGKAERLVRETTIVLLFLQSYDIPNFGSVRTAVGH